MAQAAPGQHGASISKSGDRPKPGVRSTPMGRHDADPAERRRYVAVAIVTAMVLALLVVGVLAATGFSHG
jgi:hypothetical protein